MGTATCCLSWVTKPCMGAPSNTCPGGRLRVQHSTHFCSGALGARGGVWRLGWHLHCSPSAVSAFRPHASRPTNPAFVSSRGLPRDGEGRGEGSRLLSPRACSVTGGPPLPAAWMGSGAASPEAVSPGGAGAPSDAQGRAGRGRPPGLWGDGVFCTLQPPAKLSERGAPGQGPERLHKLPLPTHAPATWARPFVCLVGQGLPPGSPSKSWQPLGT